MMKKAGKKTGGITKTVPSRTADAKTSCFWPEDLMATLEYPSYVYAYATRSLYKSFLAFTYNPMTPHSSPA